MHKKNASDWRKHLDFIVVDILCLHMAFLLAYFTRHRGWGLYLNTDYRNIAIVMTIIDVLVAVGVAKSKGEARRLIEGGGVSVNDSKVAAISEEIPAEAVAKGEFVLHKGKKVHIKVLIG